MSQESNITQLLEASAAGDASADGALIAAVYDELRVMAAGMMRRESAGHTLQPTALVNEACLRLLGDSFRWENRRHFFGAAAQAMRRVLVDHARRRDANKRGGDWARITMDGVDFPQPEDGLDVLALDEVLNALGELDARMARMVELRFFTGLSIEQTAEVLDVSAATVKRDWQFARAWLQEKLEDVE